MTLTCINLYLNINVIYFIEDIQTDRQIVQFAEVWDFNAKKLSDIVS